MPEQAAGWRRAFRIAFAPLLPLLHSSHAPRPQPFPAAAEASPLPDELICLLSSQTNEEAASTSSSVLPAFADLVAASGLPKEHMYVPPPSARLPLRVLSTSSTAAATVSE